MSLFKTALFVVYHGLMAYGIISLASYWSAHQLRQSRAREIPDLLFLFLGLAGPIMGWLLSIFLPSAWFILPGSLGFLFFLTRNREREQDRALSTLYEEDKAHAAGMIQADDKNAAAFWAMAEACERSRDYDGALGNYRSAHALGGMTVSRHELEEIEQRLADAKAAGDRAHGRPLLEMFGVAVGMLLVFWSPGGTLNLCSLMLFLAWLHSASGR